MDNIKKAIIFAVGILFTVGIIWWGTSFFGKAGNMVKTGDSSLNEVSSTISTSKFSEYDGTTVSGTQAINAIRMFATKNFTVTVNTNKGSKAYNANSYSITDISDTNYIEPTAQFKCQLGKSGNDTVNSVTLTQN
ncbi:hypothetical protein FDC64_11420 [Clostridium botulinum]|uniref:hypothetical protein n=1 Tax=Clostridium botulinum TaxID=1491 RepID=UPI0004D00D1D|nr:hypothetical protein [Clostridium botulinum]MBY6773691.1 hypothetical protein [Clostridium botulinum]MBY6864267.1 hypothetical protein [Clostridium botulinum]MBY6984854.1 hypothetical protein [Clostridium botulinum]NFP26167.1 hypothetical protein [Clostridium botulinum]